VDTEASVLSAMYSSCGIDAILAKPRYLLLALMNAFACFAAGLLSLRLSVQPFLSVAAAVNPAFWFLLSGMFFCCSMWPFAYGGSLLRVPSTEFKPHRIISVFCVICTCYALTVILYMKAVYFDTADFTHSILCEAALLKGTLSVSFNMCYQYEISICIIQIIWVAAMCYAVCFKQEQSVRMFMCGGIFIASSATGFNEMGVFNYTALIRICGIFFVGLLVTHLAAFEILNWLSKKKASKLLEDDEHLYHLKWNSLLHSSSSDGMSGLSEANALSAFITQHLVDSVDDLQVRWFRDRPQVVPVP
jgi:hypothetical protein